jgi:8-oxo-dGTP pyrophosphatase MutT (NUDIX family)
MVAGFNEYINENSGYNMGPSKNVAGVAIVWDNSILLVHPTGATWKGSGALGIPKGGIESGEDPLATAVREVREETGLNLDPSKFEKEVYDSPIFKKDGTIKSQMIYFVLRIDHPTEIGMSSTRINKESLQLEEVDWAGFIEIDKAYHMMHRSQLIVLDRLNK